MPTHSKWPEAYGFGIVGDGPCYVYSVNNRSTAHSAGIAPGDQLLELDGRNVTDMSADAIRTLASFSQRSPSNIGVVSRIQRIQLVASRRWGYGLSLTDGNPTRVQSVDPPGPAYQAGIRPGDIVLKINEQLVGSPQKWHSTLAAKFGRLTLSMIPIESKDMAVPHDPNQTKPQPSRIRKAKDLFTKMNAVLGTDFEKKMALIGLLKKYAETRDAESFARSLSVLLPRPQHRAIVQEIRPFIPVKQKLQFDAILSHNPAKAVTRSDPPSSLGPAASNSSSLTVPWSMPDPPRELKIHRLDGSFGFVLRGHNPVRVESILPGGPADKARLSVGDAILGVNSVDVSKCSHSHLIQLLQSSGSSPTLKVAPLRMDDIVNGQCSSELSGPSSWGWMSDGPALVMDGTAKTFREMADHLLTPREKAALRQALLDYKANRDVTQFVLDAAEVLDTPSKRNLWHFLLPRMSQEHQKYVRRHVTIPQSQREDTYLKGSSDSQKSSTYENTVTQSEHSDSALSYLAAQQGMRDRRHLGSFRQQLGYLLTSRERLLLKKALQIYAERRNVYNLLGDLMEILDTPSKKSLWVYIIPLLSVPHQRYCQTRLGLPEHVIKTDSVKLSRSGAFNIQRWRDMDTSRDRPRLYNRPASLWRKANGMDSSDEDMDSVSPLHNLFKPPGGHLENNRWSSRTRGSQLAQGSLQDGEQSTITCAPIYAEIDKFNNQRSAPKQSRIKLVRDSSAQTTPPSSPPSVRAWSRQTDRCSQTGQRSSSHGYDGHSSEYRENSLASIKENGSCCSSRHSKVMRGHNGDCSQATTVAAARNFDSSYEAYQMKAMNAIQALDDAVANETGSETEQMVAPPAPPAPPPLPPGLPPPPGAVEMKVKRLNWEKIDVVHENSVWAQMGDTDDLEDIVKYLELEQQFSTKRNRVSESFRDRKNEVVIISPKKAYNISILLGHMRMSVADIRQALTQMDESILTPELLKQMLAYAPDANEMEKYDAFKGSLCELSKPDQFVYQMSRLPGYEQRLKAMLFKANFAEKVEEVKKNLKCIKRAAQELQQSSKLTRILELVLAMGNRLNHGNPRVAQATAFRVNYLAMLDLTKTTDGKASFLHVLVDTVSSKFADSLRLSEDLPTVLEAARITTSVSNEVIAQELSDLRKVLQEISATVNKLSSSTPRLGDRFHEVMEHFISQASDEIQGLFSLQASTTEEFTAAINYFGDDPKKVNTCEFFNIFAEFITKFEKAHNENMLNKRNHLAIANHKSRATTT